MNPVEVVGVRKSDVRVGRVGKVAPRERRQIMTRRWTADHQRAHVFRHVNVADLDTHTHTHTYIGPIGLRGPLNRSCICPSASSRRQSVSDDVDVTSSSGRPVSFVVAASGRRPSVSPSSMIHEANDDRMRRHEMILVRRSDCTPA